MISVAGKLRFATASSHYFNEFHEQQGAPPPLARARHYACWNGRSATTGTKHMAEKTRSSKSTWIIIAVVAIVILLFAGLLPLPGQKNNTTPNVQPSAPGTQPQAEAPKGPPPSPPADAGANTTQPPPGGTPSASPGGTSK